VDTLQYRVLKTAHYRGCESVLEQYDDRALYYSDIQYSAYRSNSSEIGQRGEG
jgi:hypothetical protein